MIDDTRVYRVLGERLKQRREQFPSSSGRLTQAKIAQLVGLKRTSITNIESGTQKIPLHVLFHLCEVLRIPVADVLPALEEVQAAAHALPTQEVKVGQVTVNAGPLLREAISRIDTGESV